MGFVLEPTLEVFYDIQNWVSPQPGEYRKIRTIQPAMDRAYSQDAMGSILNVLPSIHSSTIDIVKGERLVDPHSPVEAFPNSPFATLHQRLRRLTIICIGETLERAMLFRDLPDQVRADVPAAWEQVKTLPDPKPPVLDVPTIQNLARITDIVDRWTWLRIMEALEDSYVFLKRVLATKYQYRKSPGPGPNRWVVQLSSTSLSLLDAVSSCSQWQIDLNKKEYIERIQQKAFDFLNPENPLRKSIERHLEKGRMLSEERLKEQERWMQALELGVDIKSL